MNEHSGSNPPEEDTLASTLSCFQGAGVQERCGAETRRRSRRSADPRSTGNRLLDPPFAGVARARSGKPMNGPVPPARTYVFGGRHAVVPPLDRGDDPRVAARRQRDVHPEPAHAPVAVRVRADVDEQEVPEHGANGELRLLAQELEERRHRVADRGRARQHAQRALDVDGGSAAHVASAMSSAIRSRLMERKVAAKQVRPIGHEGERDTRIDGVQSEEPGGHATSVAGRLNARVPSSAPPSLPSGGSAAQTSSMDVPWGNGVTPLRPLGALTRSWRGTVWLPA